MKTNNPLIESGFFVEYPGDDSVGMFSTSFEINGPFEFDSLEDKAAFMQSIYDAFGFYCDENRQVIPASVIDLEDVMPEHDTDADLACGAETLEHFTGHDDKTEQELFGKYFSEP